MTEENLKNDSITITTTNIPTLNSLLLSTAKSLAENSKLINNSNNKLSDSSIVLIPELPSKLLNLNSSNEFLSNLLNLNLKEIINLPLNLKNLILNLDNDLSSLAFTRYSSFLLNHESNLKIKNSFNNLNLNLNNFLISTSNLELISNKFNSNLNNLKLKRERMLKVKERIEEVEDLLESSLVIESCVKFGYWSESIDVAIKLKELNQKLLIDNNDSTSKEGRRGALILLDRVINEVQLALLSLRSRVLESLLQRELKLPGAVRGIGILRRMSDGGLGLGSHQNHQNQNQQSTTTTTTKSNEFTSSKGKSTVASDGLGEDALRIVFLAARWRCLREELDSVEGQMAASGIKFTTLENSTILKVGGDLVGIEENEERTRWTKRWIEVWREVVGETIGMYNEVFLAPSYLTINLTSTLKQSHSLTATSPLTLFLSTSLNSLTSILTHSISSLSNSASLSSLLTQLSYCSHSFARYGYEFREIEFIREKIETRVGEVVIQEWNLAGKEWSKEWNEGSGKSSTSTSNATSNSKDKKSLEEWLVRSESLSLLLSTPFPPLPSLDEDSTSTTTTNSTTEWNHLPPASIALLPPLARFLNSHVVALNGLRLLPAISLFNILIEKQEEELEKATTIFLSFIETYSIKISLQINKLLEQNENNLSPEELKLKLKLVQEKKILSFTITFFSRWVLPFIEKGLSLGVYGQLLDTDSGKKFNDNIEVSRRKRRERIEEVWSKLEGDEEQ